MFDDVLVGKIEVDVIVLFDGCLWCVFECDGKLLLGMMDYWEECCNFGICDGKVIWVW